MTDIAVRRLQAAPPEALPPSQQDLLAGVVRGERWAHAALYDLLLPVVARSLQKVLHESSADYEDLVQVSFERIVRTLTSERAAQLVSLSAWASAISAHVALDSLRARIRERKLFDRSASGALRGVDRVAAPSLERQLEARRQLEWLQGVLARMNRDQAQTVLLHDVLGHDLAAIAKLTGTSLAAAQRRLSRGHQELLRRAQSRAGKETK